MKKIITAILVVAMLASGAALAEAKCPCCGQPLPSQAQPGERRWPQGGSDMQCGPDRQGGSDMQCGPDRQGCPDMQGGSDVQGGEDQQEGQCPWSGGDNRQGGMYGQMPMWGNMYGQQQPMWGGMYGRQPAWGGMYGQMPMFTPWGMPMWGNSQPWGRFGGWGYGGMYGDMYGGMYGDANGDSYGDMYGDSYGGMAPDGQDGMIPGPQGGADDRQFPGEAAPQAPRSEDAEAVLPDGEQPEEPGMGSRRGAQWDEETAPAEEPVEGEPPMAFDRPEEVPSDGAELPEDVDVDQAVRDALHINNQ